MILRRLKEYWEAQPDVVPAGYQSVFMTKELVFEEGRLLGVQSLGGYTKGKGKDARSGKWIAVPREAKTSGVKSQLLHDNPEYVLGLVGEGRDPKKVAERHDAYIRKLEEAFAATSHPAFGVVLEWQRNGGPEALIAKGVIESSDDILIAVNGINPTDDESVRKLAQDKLPKGTAGFCLVTGEETTVGGIMPYAAKGVPGGQSSGTMLVSVNMDAGESFGLKGNFTSPIGALASESICNGLNRLLAQSDHSLRINESVYLYWQRDPSERDALHALKDPTAEDATEARSRFRRRKTKAPEPETVGAKIGTPSTGGHHSRVDRADFYVLALTANASRIVVRDYFETTLDNVQRNIDEWFARLDLVGGQGQTTVPPAGWKLARSLYRESKDIPKWMPITLLDCALHGRRLPPNLLAIAVRRNAVMQGPFVEINRKRLLSTARLALIKACLIDQPEEPLYMLNETLDHSGYQCGRLLSILESIQRLAIQGLNATLTDRHYGAACATPGIIFGGLIKDATSAHLPKLRKNRKGAFIALDRRLQQVLSQIKELPRTLDYEGQGYFALGYYHQRAHDVAEAMAKKAAGKADEAPTVLDDNASDEDSAE